MRDLHTFMNNACAGAGDGGCGGSGPSLSLPRKSEALPTQQLLLRSQSEVAFEHSPRLSPQTVV